MEGLWKIALNIVIQPQALQCAYTGRMIGYVVVLDYLGLFAASVLGLAVIIERLIRTRHRRFIDPALIADLDRSFAARDLGAARKACEGNRTVLAIVLATELAEHEKGNLTIDQVVENSADELSDKMNANLDVLATIAKIGPLLGLLGTVLGMLFAFSQVDVDVKKETLAQGIVAALDTTVRGLIIAITCLVCEGYFLRRIDRLSRELNGVCVRMARSVNRQPAGQERGDEQAKSQETSVH